MKHSTILSACGALILALCFALFAIGCHEDGGGVTSASAVSDGEALAQFETAAASASRSGRADSVSEDDISEDDNSEDDNSDDTSEDDSSDDASEDDDSEDADDAEARGLFFGVEACPVVADCVVALRIKDTLVVITSETEIVNQADGRAMVLPADLQALVEGHPGLPMKAEGTSEAGVLVARKLRIQSEIRASGEVVPGAAGCDFGLDVRGETLCFALGPGLDAPALGSTVRVDGQVPSDFTLPFVATRIKPSDG